MRRNLKLKAKIKFGEGKDSVDLIYLCCLGLGYYNNYHRLGGLKIKPLFLTVLEAESGRSRCQKSQCLVRAHFLVCVSLEITWQRGRKREHLSRVSSCKATNPVYEGSPRPHRLTRSRWGSGFLGGHERSARNAVLTISKRAARYW